MAGALKLSELLKVFGPVCLISRVVLLFRYWSYIERPLSFLVRVGGCGIVLFGELGFFLNPVHLVFFYLNEMTHRYPE